MKKHDFKKYYSQKYNVKTKGVIVPLLDGTIGFMGEDEKQYNTTKEDLIPIEEIGLWCLIFFNTPMPKCRGFLVATESVSADQVKNHCQKFSPLSIICTKYIGRWVNIILAPITIYWPNNNRLQNTFIHLK